MLIVKVKKFGVDWYIPYEMAADSAKGGFVRTPPPALIGLRSALDYQSLEGGIVVAWAKLYLPNFIYPESETLYSWTN